MGFGRSAIELLIHLRERKYVPLNPYMIELGAQQLNNSLLRSEQLVRRAQAAFGAARPFALPSPRPSMTLPWGEELLAHDAPLAREFWVSLGFDYSAIDVDGTPGSIALDLNYDEVPPELRHKYGLVTNLGTTEHVCNQLNAFRVVHDLASIGAVMIHEVPAGGSLNHGLFNYNFKFFWHLARSNEYTWLYADFSGNGQPYPIADNIVEFVKDHTAKSVETLHQCKVSDFGILVALQKTLDIPFVAPIDVNSGAKTNNAALRQRYWTVFQPDVLESAKLTQRAKR